MTAGPIRRDDLVEVTLRGRVSDLWESGRLVEVQVCSRNGFVLSLLLDGPQVVVVEPQSGGGCQPVGWAQRPTAAVGLATVAGLDPGASTGTTQDLGGWLPSSAVSSIVGMGLGEAHLVEPPPIVDRALDDRTTHSPIGDE